MLDRAKLERLGRHKVHLDCTLGRMVSISIRLRDLRDAAVANQFFACSKLRHEAPLSPPFIMSGKPNRPELPPVRQKVLRLL